MTTEAQSPSTQTLLGNPRRGAADSSRLWTAAIDADGAATAIRHALRGTLSPAEDRTLAARRALAVSGGPPDRAEVRAIATLATANSAAVLALHVSPPDGAGGGSSLVAAVEQEVRASQIGIHLLRAPRETDMRREFAHVTGYAAHLAAEAVASSRMWRAAVGVASRGQTLLVPRSWRQLIDDLGERIAFDRELDAADRSAAEAAHAGALHVMRELLLAQRETVGSGAVGRFARLTALAAAYAGWALDSAPQLGSPASESAP